MSYSREILIYVFFSFLSSFVWCNVEKSLLIRKCCSEQQQLSSKTLQCVDYLRYKDYYSTGDNETLAINVITKDNPDFPWWLDSEVEPLSSKTDDYVSSFLAGQNSSKYIKYGGRQPCENSMTKVINSNSNDYDIMDNGTLVLLNTPPDSDKNESFDPTSYCADRVEGGKFVYLLCPCAQIPCIRKCCPPNKMLSITNKRWLVTPECVSVDNSTAWKPEFYNDSLVLDDDNDVMYTFLYTFPSCESASRRPVVLNPDSSKTAKHFWLFANGSARVQDFGWGEPFLPEHYCADESRLQDGVRVRNVVLCNKFDVNTTPDDDGMFYGSMFVIGAVFLSATLLVYVLVPELRQSAHSRSLMAHTAAFLVAYVFLAAVQLRPKLPSVICRVLAFVIQWSFLAAFFWLNVMCIDISWAFSGLRHLQGSMRDRDRKKFIYYSLYAWGSPTIISIVTAVMEYSEGIPNTFIKPDFGVRACWFKEKTATLAYFYGPMAALLLSNLLLFVFTAAKIFLVRRDTAILHENGQLDRQRFVLYAKLFLLMGLTWVTEIISWAEGSTTILWYVTDFINLLRAVFIFIIFCCKPKVLKLLRQRLHELMPCWCPNVVVKQSKTSDEGRKISNTTSGTSRTDISMTQVNEDRTGSRRSCDGHVN